MMGRKNTWDYIGETCGTVFSKIEKINLSWYADELSYFLYDHKVNRWRNIQDGCFISEKEVTAVLHNLAEEAGVIAQKYGAMAIRESMDDAIEDYKDKVSDLEYQLQEAKEELQDYKERLEVANDTIVYLQRLEVA